MIIVVNMQCLWLQFVQFYDILRIEKSNRPQGVDLQQNRNRITTLSTAKV